MSLAYVQVRNEDWFPDPTASIANGNIVLSRDELAHEVSPTNYEWLKEILDFPKVMASPSRMLRRWVKAKDGSAICVEQLFLPNQPMSTTIIKLAQSASFFASTAT